MSKQEKPDHLTGLSRCFPNDADLFLNILLIGPNNALNTGAVLCVAIARRFASKWFSTSAFIRRDI
ncbi:hypothetical protein [Paenibacillus sp. RC84]|uniref:hypothetical protein n=1 Tax=Paenibacillus sp. RC84 TaxID=3156252 RepID=UPI0035159EE3